MEERICFQSQVRYDLASTKEFVRINQDSYRLNTFFRADVVVCMVYLLTKLDYAFTARMAFYLSLFCLGVSIYHWIRNRDGGIAYKRMLRSNNDQIPQSTIQIDEDGIHTRNQDSGKEILTRFDTCRYIVESKNLLIVVDDVKTAHILDKTTLTGGSRDALVSFLRKSCPKLQKHVRKGKLGCFLKYMTTALMVLGLLASTAVLLHIPEKLAGQITNDLSYQEMASELAELGIVIDPRTIQELEDYADDTGSVPFFYEGYVKVMELLSWEGMGSYDYDTWEWTPSKSGVYWFDLEVLNTDSIYTDFLRGLRAMDETLNFSNVTEDYAHVDMETGLGIVTFSFDYLGRTYTLNAQYQYDWFDTNMLTHMGRILQQDPDPKELWYSFDGQGILLYYGTEQEVLALEQKTGLIFLDPVNQFLYG